MPRPENRFDREHLRRLQQIQALIDRIYDEAVREAAAIGAGVADFDPSKAFEFADYPLTERRMAELTAWLRRQLSAAVVDGVEAAWTLSNNKNNELVYHVFGDRYDQLPEAARRRYLSTNETARDAFLRRKQQGLGLSERVWRYADEFRSEMEMGIDLGIRSGKPAAEMARDLQQYLQHPDMLFRRVRDEHGNLHLSKRAAAFHPGQGVYRSSYMNARRLAVTETNMAYRTADHERWRQMDFVVGIEIHLSNNHNCKGVPRGLFTDMCDALQGRYPKDFKFTGWHPHCRCYATTVLKTPEEMDADTERILDGEPVDGGSVNKVDDVPEGFCKWVEENQERIEGARSLPYFVRDNEKFVEVRRASRAKSVRNIHDQRDAASAEQKERIDAKRKYNSYGEEWEKAYFNEENGGYNVYHKSHQFSKKKGEKPGENGEKPRKSKMSGGEAEKFVGRTLAEKKAKQIEFLPENGNATGKPDLFFDGHTWDVKYIPLANENTIRKYIEEARKAEMAIFYWDEENRLEDLKTAINRTIGKYKKRGELHSLPSVFYMNNDGELRCLFDNS